MSSYRPISNLPVISKLLERLIAKQFIAYIEDNKLLLEDQSGFRHSHSTETAVMKVLSDILSAVHRGDTAILASLDLSAAFDTVDHGILLERCVRHTEYMRSGARLVSILPDWPKTSRPLRQLQTRRGPCQLRCATVVSPWPNFIHSLHC